MGGRKDYELMIEIGYRSRLLKTPIPGPNGPSGPNYTHRWSVYVTGANNTKIENCIQRVVFYLHDSFPNPHRDRFITNKLPSCYRESQPYINPVVLTEPPFQVKETGYAGFDIPIHVFFKNREKPNHVEFKLDLVLLTDRPNSNSRVEKVTFLHTNRDFEKCLVKSGAQLISVTKVKKERSDSPPAKKQKSYSLIPSKDMSKLAVQQAQSHSTNNNHSHSSSVSLTAQNHLLPPSQTQQQQHHKNESSQLNQNHHGGFNHHNHSNNDHNNSVNHNSNSHSLFGNHNSHYSNHQSNHQLGKQSSQQQPLLPKAKTSSRELMDVFGAPLVVHKNNKSQKTSNGKDHSSDTHRDVATVNHRSPIPPTVRQPSPQVSASQSHSHQSHSHRHKSSHHEKHHKHHHHQAKHEPVESLKTTPPPPPPAQLQASQKTSHKKQQQQQPPPPPPTQAQAFVAQADPFQVLQSRISSLTDSDRLQKIVDIVEESGEWFNLTPNKFEFDLKRLDKKTLSRIEKCLP